MLESKLPANSEQITGRRHWYLSNEEDIIEVVEGQNKQTKILVDDELTQTYLVEEANHKWPQSHQ